MAFDNYLKYLEETFLMKGYDNAHAYQDETNIFVLNYMSGTNYSTSVMQQIMITFYVEDLDAKMKEIQSIAQTISNTTNLIGFEYYKQVFSTPIKQTNFDTVTRTLKHSIILNGIITILSNANDIKSLHIDDNEIFLISGLMISYNASGDTQQSGSSIAQTLARNESSLSFGFSTIVRNDYLGNQIKAIRNEQISVNKRYNLKITHNDNSTEEHDVLIYNYQVNYALNNIPVYTITMSR